MVNPKRVYRLYREMGLQLRNKTPKRRVKAKLREGRSDATRSNQVWAMDFVHDQLATGRKLRILTVIDTFSRFSPAVDPRFSYRGEGVVRTLEHVCREVGYPKTITVDQGSEFISRDLDLWAYQRSVELDFSRPGKPTDKAFIESFMYGRPPVRKCFRQSDGGRVRSCIRPVCAAFQSWPLALMEFEDRVLINGPGSSAPKRLQVFPIRSRNRSSSYLLRLTPPSFDE